MKSYSIRMKLERCRHVPKKLFFVFGFFLFFVAITKADTTGGEPPPLDTAFVVFQQGTTPGTMLVRVEEARGATDIDIYLQSEIFTAPLFLGNALPMTSDPTRWYFMWNSSNVPFGDYSLTAKVTTSAGSYEAAPASISINNNSSPLMPPPSIQNLVPPPPSLLPPPPPILPTTAPTATTAPTSGAPTPQHPTIFLKLSQEGVIKGLLEISVQVENAEAIELYVVPRGSTAPRFIGKALLIPGSNSEWKYAWDSRSVANGLYGLVVKIKNSFGFYGSNFTDLAIVNAMKTPLPPPAPLAPTRTNAPPSPEPEQEKQNLEVIKDKIKSDIQKTTDTLQALSQRTPDDAALDSDHDGISDYDEAQIYYTDPLSQDSDKDSVPDGDEILKGTNPRDSAPSTTVAYEDPKSAGTVRNDLFSVVAVSVTRTKLKSDGTKTADRISISGKAVPGSFVTLYIFSTPIIVTVKANVNGEWSYILDKELEDGTHQIYATLTNGAGKIIARSDPIPFVKQAEAATLDKNAFTITSENTKPSFFGNQPVLIGLLLLLGVIGLALIIIGLRRSP